jgi:antitoxin component of MazEF toxin-antitoxin module
MSEYLLTVREDDDGLFIRLPPEVAEQLDASPRARVNLVPVDGGFLLSSTKPDPEEEEREHELMMRAADEVMRRYAGALQRLADF